MFLGWIVNAESIFIITDSYPWPWWSLSWPNVPSFARISDVLVPSCVVRAPAYIDANAVSASTFRVFVASILCQVFIKLSQESAGPI